jgi:hypothetical protein
VFDEGFEAAIDQPSTLGAALRAAMADARIELERPD